jgi:flagellar biosynthesis/type III secretory pathway chaperone
MQTSIQALKTLIYDKILLYQDLVECLKEEHELLIKTDVDALWEISDKKQSVVSRVEALRGKILTALSEAGIEHDSNVSSFDLTHIFSLIPPMQRRGLNKAYSSLVKLKNETRRRCHENRLFIEECLDFLDELIGILANTGKPSDFYNKERFLRAKGQVNLLLHREV